VAVAKALEVLCSEACLRVEGIFRMSGDLTKIMAVRDEMDSGKSPVFSSFITHGVLQGVHVVAGVLKLFFRSLPHPLLSEALYDDLLATHANVKNEPMAAKVAAYKPLVARVPESARKLFATLSDFINRFVIPHNDANKMHHANLAVIFGPVFVWRSNLSPMEELSNASRVNGCVKELFEAGRELFPEVVPLPGIPRAAGGGGGAAPTVTLSTSSSGALPSVAVKKSVAAAATSGSAANSPAVLRMGKNRKTESSSNVAVPAAAPEILTESSGGTLNGSGVLKPLKLLPPIPRSAMLAAAAAADDDEEEEESSVN